MKYVIWWVLQVYVPGLCLQNTKTNKKRRRRKLPCVHLERKNRSSVSESESIEVFLCTKDLLREHVCYRMIWGHKMVYKNTI